MSATYAVTGANGHLGRHIVEGLLARGHEVIAVVRCPAAAASLPSHSRLRLRLATLECVLSLKEGLDGAQGVFHAAAPTQMWAKNARRDIVEPILQGTQNLSRAVEELGMSKVVYTSTAATVGLYQDRPLDESAWNSKTRHPQFWAKMRVEQEARGMTFISLCPPSVIGPGAVKETPSLAPYRQLLEGKLPVLPPMRFHLLDVRDHAEAQIRVMEASVNRHRRYIVAGHYVDLREVVAEIARQFPKVKIPRLTLPKPFFYLFSLADAIRGMWTGDRELSWTVVRECIGCDQRLDGRRLTEEYALSFRPWQQTVTDTVHYFLASRTSP